MLYSGALLGLIAALPAVGCIAFGGPAPTGTSPNHALDEWNPKPTKGPSVAVLRRRQTDIGPETCGWIYGDYSWPVTCNSGETCMLYTASDAGMAGCCDGSDTQECGWANSCIDYDTYNSGGCGADCESNSFMLKCSKASSPYCVTWAYPTDGVLGYACTDDSFSTFEIVLQEASDTFDSFTTSITLPTISGDAVTGWDESSTTDGGIFSTATETAIDFSYTTSIPTSGPDRTRKTPKKHVSMTLIIAVVVGALGVLFVILALVIFLCVKKKKQRQLAANQQAIAATQASRPQSQYHPQMQQRQMQPMPPQTPQPQYDGYFRPADQQPPLQSPHTNPSDPQKFNPQTQVHEYPVSNPPTPAPAYVAPYYAAPNVPPMPTQSQVPYQTRESTPGAHEVDAISAPHAPAPSGQQGQQGPVYEMGHGK